jgi:hypothetical protein
VTGCWCGFHVIDVADPENPQIVASVVPMGDARGVAISGNYAYVKHYAADLQVIDVTDPTNPQLGGSVGTGGSPKGVAISDAYAYVANWRGLVVLPAQCETESGIKEDHSRLANMCLSAYPNPGSSRAFIHFETSKGGLLHASIHDVLGRRVRELFCGVLSAGDHEIVWDGRADDQRVVPAGVYLVRIAAAEGTTTARYVALR